MSNTPLLHTLCNLLTSFYPKEDSARLIASDAGLNVAHITFSGSATISWQAILSEAVNADKLPQLLHRVKQDYGTNPAFQTACNASLEHTAAPGASQGKATQDERDRQLGTLWQWGGVVLLLMTVGVFTTWANMGPWFRFSVGSTVPPITMATTLRSTETPSGVVVIAPSSTSTSTATDTPQPTATLTAMPTSSETPPLSSTLPTAMNTPATPTYTPVPTVHPTRLAGATRIVDDIVYVYIPAGELLMGSNDTDIDKAVALCHQVLANCQRAWFGDELPQHPVYVDAFWMMQSEVTNAHYQRCVEAGECSAPTNSRWNDKQYAKHPVTNVTWQQANTYAEWMGGRLPTEAEWEKACRGMDGRIYSWGNENPDQTRLNYKSNVGSTTEVGLYPSGAYGLYDMAGNVWEWTSSKYQPYTPVDGWEELEGDTRTLRGGSWDGFEIAVRCADRIAFNPSDLSDTFGLRVVVSSPGF